MAEDHEKWVSQHVDVSHGGLRKPIKWRKNDESGANKARLRHGHPSDKNGMGQLLDAQVEGPRIRDLCCDKV